jgi:hypothetical protein
VADGDGDTLVDTMLADDDADGDPEATLVDGDANGLADKEGVRDSVAPPLELVDGVPADADELGAEVDGLALTTVPNGDRLGGDALPDPLANKEGETDADGVEVTMVADGVLVGEMDPVTNTKGLGVT